METAWGLLHVANGLNVPRDPSLLRAEDRAAAKEEAAASAPVRETESSAARAAAAESAADLEMWVPGSDWADRPLPQE